jgi:hypothetical protein
VNNRNALRFHFSLANLLLAVAVFALLFAAIGACVRQQLLLPIPLVATVGLAAAAGALLGGRRGMWRGMALGLAAIGFAFMLVNIAGALALLFYLTLNLFG